MISAFASTLFWDLDKERITLGGALVLRLEGEILARHNNLESLDIYVNSSLPGLSFPTKIMDVVFRTSSVKFNILQNKRISSSFWPSVEMMAIEHFSYYSFSRLIELFQLTGYPITLSWNRQLIEEAEKIRKLFETKLICIHLKQVAPFDPVESNADFSEWAKFLKSNSKNYTFLIIGDDPVSEEIKQIKNVFSASDLQLSLAQQLCVVSISDGFLGMASGICNAASFSSVPHVLFKHPLHHTSDMKRELSDSDRFSFSNQKQLLWRCEANEKKLQGAFNIITD